MTTIDEGERLAILKHYEILDTEPELLDDLTLLASHICGTPIAADHAGRRRPPVVQVADRYRDQRNASRRFVLRPRDPAARHLFIVPTRRHDVRFRDNPQVTGEPHIRFYAGAPLVTPDGHALGTLCVVDRVAPNAEREQREALDRPLPPGRSAARAAADVLELGRALAERDAAETEQASLTTSCAQPTPTSAV